MSNKLPDWMPEEENDFQAPSAPGSAPSVPATSSLAPKPTARKSSSGFTNLKKYIQANKDSNLANTVTAQSQAKLASSNQQLQDTKNQFQTSLENERNKLQGVAGEAQKARSYIDTGAQPLIQEQAPSAFTGVKPTDTFSADYAKNLEEYNKQLAENQRQRDQYNARANEAAKASLNTLKNFVYAGPTEIANQNQLASNQAELQDFAKATSTEAGRGAILQTLFGKRGQYSGGARNLDTALLGASPDALNKFRDIRSQANKYNQNLQKLNQEATTGVGATKSTIDIEKAKNALALKQLRDSLKSRLESEAAAYNAAQQADIGQVDIDELKKWLPEMAGYDLTDNPAPLSTIVGKPRVGNPNPYGLDTEDQTPNLGAVAQSGALDTRMRVAAQPNYELPVTDQPETRLTPEEQLYINLYRNKGFEERQKVDPNRDLQRVVEESGGLHRDWQHEMYGAPNKQQAYIGIEGLKPLFKESYTDNTWDSINQAALERRNVLSQVLQDDAENGILTPKQRNEIQVELNDSLLTKLKETPKMAEEKYLTDFYAGAPGTTAIQAVDAYKDLAPDTNPFEYLQRIGLDYNPNANYGADGKIVFGGGNKTGSLGSAAWNPQTKKVEIQAIRRTGIDPRTRQEIPLNYSPQYGWMDNNGRRYDVKNTKAIPYTKSISGEEFLNQNRVFFGLKGWNNNVTAGTTAKALQTKYILDRLKGLGFAKPDIKVV